MLLASGCGSALPPRSFVGSGPRFDPVEFWAGHTDSWGVIENRDGAPTAIVQTHTDGTLTTTSDGSPGLRMTQQLNVDGKLSVRDWEMRRRGDGQFEARANDMVGTARGLAVGRTFHWTWTLAASPGNALKNVSMEQWMYLADNGTLMNRTIITKLGVRLAEVSEQFVRRN